MATFYFTYGYDDDNQAYKGGWTEVEADTAREAVAGYMAYHPANERGLIPCCSVAYSRQHMEKSGMLKKGNFGIFCHDRITIKRERRNANEGRSDEA